VLNNEIFPFASSSLSSRERKPDKFVEIILFMRKNFLIKIKLHVAIFCVGGKNANKKKEREKSGYGAKYIGKNHIKEIRDRMLIFLLPEVLKTRKGQGLKGSVGKYVCLTSLEAFLSFND
jgi:hypothetical protein